MRKQFLLVAILAFVFIASYSGYAYACGSASCSAEKSGSVAISPASAEEESELEEVEFANVFAVDEEGNEYAVCPISSSAFKVSEGTSYSMVDGKGYYYCCAGCEKPFQADPEKHMSKMKKTMAEAQKKFEKGERPGESHM